jgi:hypothetical protein
VNRGPATVNSKAFEAYPSLRFGMTTNLKKQKKQRPPASGGFFASCCPTTIRAIAAASEGRGFNPAKKSGATRLPLGGLLAEPSANFAQPATTRLPLDCFFLGAQEDRPHRNASVPVVSEDTSADRSSFRLGEMAQRDGEIENLAHAYRILDARWDASPRAIKGNYRKLVKRWHPDRHTPGTPEHTEATLMTRLLNEAYTRIENAPLRNGFADPAAAYPSGSAREARNQAGDEATDQPDPSGASRSEYVPRDPVEDATDFYRLMENARKAGARDDAAQPFDWVGFAVRFVIGALFGVLVSFRVTIELYRYPESVPVAVAVPVAVVVTILVCALASGFGGDAFWRAIRPGGIWRWGRWR